jgi:hypothetical protein
MGEVSAQSVELSTTIKRPGRYGGYVGDNAKLRGDGEHALPQCNWGGCDYGACVCRNGKEIVSVDQGVWKSPLKKCEDIVK